MSTPNLEEPARTHNDARNSRTHTRSTPQNAKSQTTTSSLDPLQHGEHSPDGGGATGGIAGTATTRRTFTRRRQRVVHWTRDNTANIHLAASGRSLDRWQRGEHATGDATGTITGTVTTRRIRARRWRRYWANTGTATTRQTRAPSRRNRCLNNVPQI